MTTTPTNSSALPSLEDTLARFENLLESQPNSGQQGHARGETYLVCQAAARWLGMSGTPVRGSPLFDISVAETAECFGLFAREIELTGHWWQHDHGVIIVKELNTGRPVLIRSSRGRTAMVYKEPGGQGHLKPLTAQIAANLETHAVTVHPTLPEKPLRFKDIIKAGLRLYPFDIAAYILLGIFVALLSYAVPTASGLVIDQVIPHRSLDLLYAVLTVVIGTNLSMLFLRRSIEIIAQRLEGEIGTHLQAGMLDRLFRQPLRFFSIYTQAELMRRFNALEGARRIAMRIMAGGILDLSVLLVGLALLTFYFPKGALVVAVVTLTVLIVAIFVAIRSYRAFYEGEAMSANVLTIVYELVANMWPIRMYGVQRRAFLRWRDSFIEMRRRVVRSTRYGIFQAAFLQFSQLVTLACVFAIVAYAAQPNEGATLGYYVAFIGSLSLVTVSVGNLCSAILSVSSILPSVGMAAPILAAIPDPMVGKRHLRELHGAVGFAGVNFRYTEDSPWVLYDFSIKIEAGEYLGIVGSTGAGKSSLVKLLLGLLQPSQGRINFDQTDLRLLDLDRLREQFGVVLQDCRLVPGSILENVAAGREVELDKVLIALESVGLGEFIQGLPMGVHTMIGESASGFSGGQVQLLALARALVGEPRLLLFDEPTSALDNASVTKVGKVLASLKITRIVISHRLGTLQSCDRIVVLDQGRIVQQGLYEELANQPGLFQQLLHGKTE